MGDEWTSDNDMGAYGDYCSSCGFDKASCQCGPCVECGQVTCRCEEIAVGDFCDICKGWIDKEGRCDCDYEDGI